MGLIPRSLLFFTGDSEKFSSISISTGRAVGFWLVNRKYAEENPDKVVRFLAGAMDAQEMLTNNPKASAQNISTGYKVRGFDYSADVFLSGLQLFNFDWQIEDLHN